MDETDVALACILEDCKDDDDLAWYIGRLATIVQQLTCRMAREVAQTEAGIRTLYSTWADLAAEQFTAPRRFPDKKPH